MPPLIPQEAAASRARAGMERNGMEQGCGEGKAPCTLEHAIQQAEQIGITTAEADFWWHFRSADGWMKGSKENRRIVGANWHHDAKQFTMSVRQRQGEQGDGGRKPGKAKDEPVWAMKRDLREINKELEAIESERVGVWGNLPEKFQAQKRLLQTQKRTLLGRIEAAEKQST